MDQNELTNDNTKTVVRTFRKLQSLHFEINKGNNYFLKVTDTYSFVTWQYSCMAKAFGIIDHGLAAGGFGVI
jgi:hypothetical protein